MEDNEAVSSGTQSSSYVPVGGTACDDDKGKMMEAVMKTYIKQQEKLHTILQKKQNLQMVCLPKASFHTTFHNGSESK